MYWNGKPISALDSAHIERILSACRRGIWADGKPCRVNDETQRALRQELRSRGAQDWLPDTGAEAARMLADEMAAPPVPPPNYDAQLAAMGYEPPPPPIAAPAPWSPPTSTKLPSFPSVTDDPMRARGQRRIAQLEEEVSDLKDLLRGVTRERDVLEREGKRVREQRDTAQAALRRVQTRLDRLEGRGPRGFVTQLLQLEDNAEDADLDELDAPGAIAWWRGQLGECSGILARGVGRLLDLAARGIDVRDIKPRKLRRPGIERDG